jgi:hypothetical protein
VEAKCKWAQEHAAWATTEGLRAEERQLKMLVQDCDLMLEEMSLIEKAKRNADQSVVIRDEGPTAWGKAIQKRQAPIWLSEHWERRKTETVDRVRTAIKCLTAEQQPVIVNAIREKVKAIFGVPFSANTIKRNEAAHALYMSCRQPYRSPAARDTLLRDLYASASDTPDLYARVARLRRQSKDHLIARLILLERAAELHGELENRLREEIIRNSLQTRTGEVGTSGAGPLIKEKNGAAATATGTTIAAAAATTTKEDTRWKLNLPFGNLTTLGCDCLTRRPRWRSMKYETVTAMFIQN